MNLNDVLLAYRQEKLDLHSSIWVRYNKRLENPTNLFKTIKLKDKTFIEYYDNLQIRKDQNGKILSQYLQTTTGRVIFNYVIQKALNLSSN